MTEIGRFEFDDGEGVGIYRLDHDEPRHSAAPWKERREGDVELVWFSQQSPQWPVLIPREMWPALVEEITRIGKGK